MRWVQGTLLLVSFINWVSFSCLLRSYRIFLFYFISISPLTQYFQPRITSFCIINYILTLSFLLLPPLKLPGTFKTAVGIHFPIIFINQHSPPSIIFIFLFLFYKFHKSPIGILAFIYLFIWHLRCSLDVVKIGTNLNWQMANGKRQVKELGNHKY